MERDVWEELSACVRRGDDEAVVRRLEGLDETQRHKISKRVQALAREIGREPWEVAQLDSWQRFGAAQALVIGTAGPATAAAASWLRARDDVVRQLLLQRPREWRQEWAGRIMDRGDDAEWMWSFVHGLVRDDAIDPPASDGYVRHAVSGLRQYAVDHGPRDRTEPRLADVLRAEPHFLEHELWRLLAMEDSGLTARGGWFHGVSQTWTEALVELAAEGTLDRQRLLDASLAALRSDFSPYHARWHHQFHEALEPTAEEHAARLAELLALLASPDAAVVGFALRALGKLEKAGRLDAAAFAEAAPPAITHPTKGHAVRAIKLTARVLKRSPEAARLVLPVLVDALAHEAREVQEAGLGVVEKHDGALTQDDRARLAELAALVDAAARERMAALAGEPPPPPAEPVAAAVAIPPLRPVDRLAPRLRDAEPLVPVEDLADLLDRAAVAYERGDDPDELELLLDGVSRLRREPVDAGRRRALLDRIENRTFEIDGRVTLIRSYDALGALLGSWLNPAEPLRLWAGGDTPTDAIAQRVRELIDDLAGPPRPLLAAPTHRGGWIDPAEAVRRVAALDGRPLECDLAQMVMRLAPDGRDEARRAAEALPGEAGRVLVRALGGDARRPALSKLKLAWSAADDARDPAALVLPVDAIAEFAPAWTVSGGSTSPRTDTPLRLLKIAQVWWAWETSHLERWVATVWPANREPLYRVAVLRMRDPFEGGRADAGDILELLIDPAEPVGPQAASALALALGGEAVEIRALGADVAIAVLESRRLDGAGLGERLAWVLREHPQAVPARWGPALADVAAAGPLHAHDVQVAIERLLAAAGTEDRRRLLPVVELLRRLAVEGARPITEPAARAWLEAISGSSKIARAAREALAVT